MRRRSAASLPTHDSIQGSSLSRAPSAGLPCALAAAGACAVLLLAVATLRRDAAAADARLGGVIILSMHRSGASTLASLLRHEEGFFVGPEKLMTRLQQRVDVIEANDWLLQTEGASWDQPRAVRAPAPSTAAAAAAAAANRSAPAAPSASGEALAARQQQRLAPIARELVAGAAAQRGGAGAPWLLKDPRLVPALPAWDAALRAAAAIQPRDGSARDGHALILVYRHPIAVALSLSRVDGIALARGFTLWLEYNRLAVSAAFGHRGRAARCAAAASHARLVAVPAAEARRVLTALHACGLARGEAGATRSRTLSHIVGPQKAHEHVETPDGFREDGWHDRVGAFRAWCGGARDDDTGARLWAQLAEEWHLRKESAGALERQNEERAFGSALRAFCAMEDSSAFEPGFAWPQLPAPPAMPP